MTPREALADGRPALVWRRQVADTETPVAAALKLIEPGRGDFLLESVEGGETRGRHSLIGLAPDLLFRAHGQSAEINRHWATDRETFEPCGVPTLDAPYTVCKKGDKLKPDQVNVIKLLGQLLATVRRLASSARADPLSSRSCRRPASSWRPAR